MNIRSISTGQWKILLCAALFLFGAVCAGAIVNWQQVIMPGVAGTLNFDVAGASGRTARIVRIDPASPLAGLGAKAGDKVTFDDLADVWRAAYAADEAVGLTLGEGAGQRHLTVRNQPVPHIDRGSGIHYVLTMVNSVVALTLAALIGLRRTSSPSARILALMLLMETSFATSYVAGGGLMRFSLLVLMPLAGIVAYCGLYLFSCRFPDDGTAHVPSWVRRTAWPAMLLLAAYFVQSGARRYGLAGILPTVPGLVSFLEVLLVMLACVNLWHAFRCASGEARQRVRWIGLLIGVRYMIYAITTMPGVTFLHSYPYAEIPIVLAILANVGLAYGILRHRVLDVGFAVNRALVFTIVSVVLLVSFGLMEWLAHHFVSPEEAEKNAFLDAGIALGLYLIFHKLRHFVDHAVDRLFFHKWHVNEERLRRFVKHAAHITSPQVLVDSTMAALQRFTGEAGCALYREVAGGYELAAVAGLQAPSMAGIDDPLAVALRAELAAAAPADCDSTLPGALALPMSFRGDLQGFVLLGQKPSGDAYRPDEIAVLEHAAHQVGLDLQALRTEQLQLEVNGLRQELAVYAKGFEARTGAAALPM